MVLDRITIALDPSETLSAFCLSSVRSNKKNNQYYMYLEFMYNT